MTTSIRHTPLVAVVVAATLVAAPAARADNQRLNNGVIANVRTIQNHAGCAAEVKPDPRLGSAAESHAIDVLNNRSVDGDVGSDGSTAQSRADAAGFRGKVAETVAIDPALAISGIEILHQWYYNARYLAIMSDCANTEIGVWSANSPDRSVVVAVYGQPATPVVSANQHVPLDPTPDYDASDEIEFGINWWAWILRGVYPPPAQPPS